MKKKINDKNKKKKPTIFLAKTTKGKGVTFLEGHGKWHHKIPNEQELKIIKEELKIRF